MQEKHDEKLSFETKQQAEAALVVAKHQHGSKNLKVYKCKKCLQWHIATRY